MGEKNYVQYWLSMGDSVSLTGIHVQLPYTLLLYVTVERHNVMHTTLEHNIKCKHT